MVPLTSQQCPKQHLQHTSQHQQRTDIVAERHNRVKTQSHSRVGISWRPIITVAEWSHLTRRHTRISPRAWEGARGVCAFDCLMLRGKTVPDDHLANRRLARPAPVDGGQGLWRELLLPMLTITVTGVLAVLFLITCNRIPSLEVESKRLERCIAQEQSIHLELLEDLAKVKDPQALRAFASEHGLTEQPPPEDVVIIPPLPPVQPAASLASEEIWIEPAEGDEDTTLAHRPGLDESRF